MESEILRVRLPKTIADTLNEQASALGVNKPDLARIVIARGLLGLKYDNEVLKSHATTGDEPTSPEPQPRAG